MEDQDPASMEIAIKRSLISRNKLAIIVQGDGGQTLYCCVECSARYTDKDKLEIHLCSEHDKEYRHLCGICGTGLKRKEHLDRHLLGHQEVRPHVCADCGKGFKRKEHLNIHRSIHSGDKSQVCPLCDRSFYRKDHLQKHLQTHTKNSELDISEVKMEPADVLMQLEPEESEQTNENMSVDPLRPFACCVCHKTYKRKDHLKLHSYTHMAKDKICTQCGKAFHKEDQLLAHMAVHLEQSSTQLNRSDDSDDINPLLIDTNSLLQPRAPKSDARPHACEVCGRRFKRRQHLKVHANVHRPTPTIWCSLCSFGFHTNSEFEQHECVANNDCDMVTYDEPEYHNEDVEPPHDSYHSKEVHNGDYENDYPESYEQMSVEGLSIAPLVSLEEQHIPTPQRVYVCKFCSKPFKRKDHYKIHLHIHTGVKSFFCPDCGKGFYRKDHLQKHSLVHLKARIKPRRQLPDLFPISMLAKPEIPTSMLTKPEITITAPMNTKLRLPLQIKVPYQMVTATPSGEQRAVTITPH